MTELLLVIADDPAIRQTLARALPELGYSEAPNGESALSTLRENVPDLILVDQHLPDGDGIGLIKRIRAIDGDVPIMLIGGDAGGEALRQGANEVIEKPFKTERLRHSVQLLLEKQRLSRQVARLAGKTGGRVALVAQSSVMKRLVALIKRVATAPASTVLIQGERGVGKELVARAIHERSGRSARAFVSVNCAALSESLLDAELFGYEKGAMPGADGKSKSGLVEVADGGTLYLDEIGSLPPALQVKLYRLLQERRYRRVGGMHDIEADVRVIAACAQDLRHEVTAGRFRQDLYFRLRVVPIEVPSLRERQEDILPLADHLLQRLAPELGRPELRLSPNAREAVRAYAWPGNVRELANAIERAVIVAEGAEISVRDLSMDEQLVAPRLPEGVPPPPPLPEGALIIPPSERNVARIEAMVIKAVLEEVNGHKSKAAEALGINRTTLYNKLRELNLMPATRDSSSDSWPAVKVIAAEGEVK